jgi:hypothetical protein
MGTQQYFGEDPDVASEIHWVFRADAPRDPFHGHFRSPPTRECLVAASDSS